MAVKIRLKRMGARHHPFYRLVAADSRKQRDGRFLEILGYYDPLTDPPTVEIKEELVFKWLQNGAQPTDTARSLLRRKGTWQKWEQQKAQRKGKNIAPAVELEEVPPVVEEAPVEPEVEEPAVVAEAPAVEAETTPAETEAETKE